MCKWGREEGSAAGSFPFKCGSAHMEPHCAAPRMRGPSARPGRASSAARPGTKGGGAATPSPSDTPLTPRSPRPRHPGRARPPARSPTPPPPRPSRPLAPGGPPRPSPRVPPQHSHPLPRPQPLLPGHLPPPPAGACGAPAASPDNKGASGLPLPGTGGEGEPARGGGTRAAQVPAGRGASAWSQPGPGVPHSGGGGTILLPPLLSGASETPPNISPHESPALRDELRLGFPPAPGRRDRKGRGRGVLQACYRGAGGPTSVAGGTPRSSGGTGAAEGTLPHRAGPAPLPRLPWQQSPVGLPLPRSA